ncbi:GGDEF domain-containing protein [Aurantiacibacter hainanensis]|uniref:GGDEF domain-containing protein n=1 Tax=Aurantiacibacter hainanensis TaxID=3076114 RepID=UPI0030C753E5
MREQILGLTTPLTAVVFMVTLLVMWRQGRMGRHVLVFAIGYGLFAIGFGVTHLFPTGSPLLFHVSQLFYAAASTCLIWGVCHRIGVSVSLPALGITYVAAALALVVAVVLSDDAGPRLIIVNTGYGVMFVIGAVTLLGSPRRGWMDNLIIAALALNALDFLLRPSLTLLAEGAIPVGEYRQSIYYSVINLVLTVKALGVAMVLIGACFLDMFNAVHERAKFDPMTGLRMREAFEKGVNARLAAASREGVPVSLVVADIDHFKQVNDLWGHQAGDEAIAAFGALLSDSTRKNDLAGRVGGEEFCVLVWDCAEASALQLAERLRLACAQLVHPALGDGICLTASFGVVDWRGGESYAAMFARADAALYSAKEAGRNRVASDAGRAARAHVVPARGVVAAA